MITQTEKLLTAEAFDALGDIGRAELVRGNVAYLAWEKPRHGRITMNLGVLLANFIRSTKLGDVYLSEIGYVVGHDPDSVRAPDLSFVRAEIALAQDEGEWYPHSPDLAVEVLSPTDRPAAVADKVQMWLDGGARSVWVVDPAVRTVTVHRADGTRYTVGEAGELKDEGVLPGLRSRRGGKSSSHDGSSEG